MVLILIVGLQVPSSTASQSVKTYVSRSESRNLRLVVSPTILSVQESADSLRPPATGSPKRKSPTVAFLYALIPGAIVHGAGHFYAGADSIGRELQEREVLGIGMILIWLPLAYVACDVTAVHVLALIGVILFVESWVVDLVGAPLAAKKYNEGLLGGENTGAAFDPDKRNDYIGFRITRGL